MKHLSALVALALFAVPAFSQNRVSLADGAVPVEYNPMIFGSFLEHFSTQIYGGIFDPGNPLSKIPP